MAATTDPVTVATDRWPEGTKLTYPTRPWRLRERSDRRRVRFVHAVSYLLGEPLPVAMCRVGDVLASRPPADPTGLLPCPLCVERLRFNGLWPL